MKRPHIVTKTSLAVYRRYMHGRGLKTTQTHKHRHNFGDDEVQEAGVLVFIPRKVFVIFNIMK